MDFPAGGLGEGLECQLQGCWRWPISVTVPGALRIPSCDQQQPNRQGRTRC